jgi:hypothetical protein
MNFNKKQRDNYLSIAKSKGYRTKIIVLHESRETCMDRMISRFGSHETINNYENAKSALGFFFKHYEKPTPDEADEVQFIYPERKINVKTVIIDLDGTLCNVDHRLHHVRNKPKNWKKFFDEMVKDTPYSFMVDVIKGLSSQGYRIIYCSGRPNNYQNETLYWLTDNGLYYGELYMRSAEDHREDTIIKEIILDFELKTRYSNIVMTIDDRSKVVDMWRRNGLICMQVAKGDF